MRCADALLVCALAVAVGGCAEARRSAALGTAPDALSAAEARGQRVFMENCNACHVGGAGALGPGINNKPLPDWLIRVQVRNGFGAMPSFSERKISDRELDDLIAYLNALE